MSSASTVPADVEERLARLDAARAPDLGAGRAPPRSGRGALAVALGLVVVLFGAAGVAVATSAGHWILELVLQVLAGCAVLGGAFFVYVGTRIGRLEARTPAVRVAACVVATRSLDCGGDPPRVLRYLMFRLAGGDRREFCVPARLADRVGIGDFGWATLREDELLAFDVVPS